MKRQIPTSLTADGEMRLSELLAIFRARWLLVMGSLAFALACAGIYLALVPSQYEASVIIQLATVGDGDGIKKPIESGKKASQRMNGHEFKSAVISSLGWTEEMRVGLLKDSFQVVDVSEGFVEVKVRGMSREDAASAATASADVISSIYRPLSEEDKSRKKIHLERINTDIEETEAFLRDLQGLNPEQYRQNDAQQYASVLLLIRDAKRSLRSLEASRIIAQKVMGDEFYSPTDVFEAVSVSDHAVQPKTKRVWLFSALLGILVGAFLVTAVEIRRMKRGAASLSAGR